ncbi:MAG: PQQ-dependent sugar dehydrogenase, partial [Myxococcota bacterium]
SSVSSEDQLFRVRQPASNHNGGALQFGNDGYLYMSLGDGGSGNDPWCSGLNLGTPLGKLLRFDVHSSASGYTIPSDNPYAEGVAGPNPLCNDHQVALTVDEPDLSRTAPCPEIYAYGLRNPFRMSVDRATGWLWIGDVGQGAVEEITAVDPSASSPNYNLGWPAREGDIAKPGGLPMACDELVMERGALNTDYTEPRFVHKHNGPTGLSSRSSVVAGFVYRGDALGAAYSGRFIYGDFGSGEVWALQEPYTAGTVDVDGLETNINTRNIGFAQDAAGELIILTLGGPELLGLATPGTGGFPQRLTDHPCFDSNDPTQVVSGVIPYEPSAQLWSDGATKRRFLAVPDGETIDRAANCGTLSPAECEAQGDFEFPIGSVLIKEFALGDTTVETRVFMRHADGDWGSYSYAWNDEQTDAVLQNDAVTRTVAGQSWAYPGVASCSRCHTGAAGITLGLETRQLAGEIAYPTGRTSPQLETLDHIGLLSPALGAVPVTGYPTPGAGVDVENEARAYLHANCSMCHRPMGGTNSDMVLTYDTALEDMGICDVDPVTRSWPELTDPKLLAPGAPARSVLSVRMESENPGERMPPLASEIADPVGTAAVNAWIQSLSSCP